MPKRSNFTALFVLLALVLGAAGGYFWQSRAARTVTSARDAAVTENIGLKANVGKLESQVRGLQADKSKLDQQLEAMTGERNDLASALQVTTATRDVAVAFGKASVTRNQAWIRALMTADLAASYTLRQTGPDMVPSRYEIGTGPAGNGPWTYVVKVWYNYKTQGQAGYTVDTLTVVKAGDVYKIQAVKAADYISQNK
ncbi:MAG TPA: hypothetical protein VGK74_05450 [Symbiobacteriaceae bacterium]|jgi:hypothetical protein